MSLKTDTSLRSVVSVRATVPEEAFTAPMLGTERSGSGVIINDKGLILTAGYLIVEAEAVQLTTSDGANIDGHPLAYDHETGFGLVQALGKLNGPAIPLGDSDSIKVGDEITLAGARATAQAEGKVLARQEFVGPWEYLVNDAIFTAPARPDFSGAPLLDADGRLVGLGSLALQAGGPNGVHEINMSIPINLLHPILDDLVKRGRRAGEPRPWLGLFAAEQDGDVTVVNVDPRGPAAQAGFEQGDIIRDVRNEAVDSLPELYRKVWGAGPAGVELPVRVVRDGREQWLRIKTDDRNALLRKPTLQ